MYVELKSIHLGTVALSACLFAVRGGWMLADSPRLRQRWVRIVPHLIDTVLLASAIGLCMSLHQYPFVQGWLTAKLMALLAYIGFGSLALKRGRSKAIRTAALIAALATFAYIVAVARTHDPWPLAVWLR